MLINFIFRLVYHWTKVPANISCRRLWVTTRDGATIAVDLFMPRGDATPPCLMYLPGGGFVLRATPFHKKVIAMIAWDLGIAAALIHYRLAPKHLFPTAFHDVLDTWDYLVKNAESLGIDPSRFAIGGDSAGGNLATGATLYNKDKVGHPLNCTLLVYPATDRDQKSRSRRQYTDTPLFDARRLQDINRKYYANGFFGLEQYAFPLHHKDVSGIPPVYVETAEYDPLHDDGTLFFNKLIKAGVTAVLNDTKGTIHGYDVMQNSEIVKDSLRRRKAFVNEHL